MDKIKNCIDIIGALTDSGAGIRGAQLGPKAIRFAGLVQQIEAMNFCVRDCGDVAVLQKIDSEKSNQSSNCDCHLKNLNQVNQVNGELYQKVSKSIEQNHLPIVLGGDHSISAGTICAAQKHFGKIGIIWVDAHGDYNTPKSTPSGNIHGMPLAALTGNGSMDILPFKDKCDPFTSTQNTVLVGIRDLDAPEKQHIKDCGVSVFSMQAIDQYGIAEIAKQAIEIASHDTNGIYISFDLDSVDPETAPGVSTPVSGGLTYREAHLLCELIAQSNKIIGIDMVEHNPINDIKNRTGKLAVELITSLLGKVIY